MILSFIYNEDRWHIVLSPVLAIVYPNLRKKIYDKDKKYLNKVVLETVLNTFVVKFRLGQIRQI